MKKLLKYKRKCKKKSNEFFEGIDDFLNKNLSRCKASLKKNYKRILDYIKKNHSDKLKSLKEFFLIVSGYGLVINYSLHFLLGATFTFFTVYAWGIAYYFLKDEFVEWFRRLIAKR